MTQRTRAAAASHGVEYVRWRRGGKERKEREYDFIICTEMEREREKIRASIAIEMRGKRLGIDSVPVRDGGCSRNEWPSTSVE